MEERFRESSDLTRGAVSSYGVSQTPQQHRILITEPLASAPTAWLSERAQIAQQASDTPSFHEHLESCDGLIIRTYTRVNDALLDRAPRLRVIGRAGVGLDNIDVPACRSRGVEVVHAPAANTQSVVEYVLALLLPRLRPVEPIARALPREAWMKRREVTPGRELGSLALGILGLGRIGRRLAAVAGAIGARVIYHDLLEIPPAERWGAKPVDLTALFEQSDVISLHVDGRASNRHFVAADLIDRMREDVVLINTSRGFVVDSAALAEFLRAHERGQALIDVHDPEPFGEDYALLSLPNATLLPHLGARTREGMENMSWVVRDVLAVLEGRTPRFPAP